MQIHTPTVEQGSGGGGRGGGGGGGGWGVGGVVDGSPPRSF